MKFITVRDLRSKTAEVRRDLEQEREIVVTANGRPFAVMTPVDSDTVEDEIRAIRRARAQAAVDRVGAHARARGLDQLTMNEIDTLIAEARRARRGRK